VVQKALKKSLGTDPGEVLAINVQFPNGYLDCASPYSGIKQMAESFQAVMSGAALAARTTSVADAVTRLADLRSEGVITDDEFNRAKRGFVGATVEVGESAASVLRQLHSLQTAGVLTESEFRMK